MLNKCEQNRIENGELRNGRRELRERDVSFRETEDANWKGERDRDREREKGAKNWQTCGRRVYSEKFLICKVGRFKLFVEL